MDQRNLIKAQEYYLRSLKIAEKNNLQDKAFVALSNLGNICKDRGELEPALKHYTRAFDLAKELKHDIYMSYALINIAAVYQAEADTAEARGNAVLKKQKTKLALDNFLHVLDIARKSGDNFTIAHTLGNVGEIYLHNKEYKKAIGLLNESYELAGRMKYTDLIKSGLERLYRLHKETNEPEKALAYFEQFTRLNDSLAQVNSQETLTEMQVKYDTEKKEVENRALAQDNRLQALTITKNRYLVTVLILLVLLVIISGILTIRQNKLQSRHKAMMLEQKILRTQMNPHFIFNSLASIESFIYEHQPREAGIYLASFSRLMRLVLENSSSEYITLDKEIEILNYYLSLQKLRMDNRLTYSIEVDPALIPHQTQLPTMFIQPFIENAIEHGFRGRKHEGYIKVQFQMKGDDLCVQVTDNGIGIEKALKERVNGTTHSSMAMKITNERMALLNRSRRKKMTLTVSDLVNEKTESAGTKIFFSIPLS